MTVALEGGGVVSSMPRPHFIPEETWYPFYKRLGEPQGWYGRAENLVPTGIRSRTVHPVVSHYTDWATWPTVQGEINPLNNNLNSICHLLALLGDHHVLHINRERVKVYTDKALWKAVHDKLTQRGCITSQEALNFHRCDNLKPYTLLFHSTKGYTNADWTSKILETVCSKLRFYFAIRQLITHEHFTVNKHHISPFHDSHITKLHFVAVHGE